MARMDGCSVRDEAIPNLKNLTAELQPVVRTAGARIMEIYQQDPQARLKQDGSPVTAADEADVYPRFSPTMEWDTAAGDAVLRAAGGRMTNPDNTVFIYVLKVV